MVFNGEVDADCCVIIDASEDKKDLKYEVMKDASARLMGCLVLRAKL